VSPVLPRSSGPRIALLALLATGAAAFVLLGGYRYLTFGELVEHEHVLVARANAHPVSAPLLFCLAYLVLGFFGLPGNTVLMISSGVLFGFWRGLCLVIMASTAASTLAFLSFRYLFRSLVEGRVSGRLREVEEGLRREGAYFVFALRLLPVVPYSVANLVLAVSPVTFGAYVGMSLLGLLPRYALYTYTGTRLGDVQNPDDLFSPPLVAALALLAVLPWIIRKVVPKARRSAGTR
jgi:uncharacterized membrane protein YdjX (TVP38/TMEM64 family)